MATPYNPSLHEEPQSQKAIIIAPRADESLFGWLEGTGRFVARDLADDKFGSRADDELEAILDTSSSYASDVVEEEEDDDDDED